MKKIKSLSNVLIVQNLAALVNQITSKIMEVFTCAEVTGVYIFQMAAKWWWWKSSGKTCNLKSMNYISWEMIECLKQHFFRLLTQHWKSSLKNWMLSQRLMEKNRKIQTWGQRWAQSHRVHFLKDFQPTAWKSVPPLRRNQRSFLLGAQKRGCAS